VLKSGHDAIGRGLAVGRKRVQRITAIRVRTPPRTCELVPPHAAACQRYSSKPLKNPGRLISLDS